MAAVFSNEEGIRAVRKAAGRARICAVKPNEGPQCNVNDHRVIGMSIKG